MAFKHAPVTNLASLLQTKSARIAPLIAMAANTPGAYRHFYQRTLAKRKLAEIEPWRELSYFLELKRVGLPADTRPKPFISWLRGALRARGLDGKRLLAWYDPKADSGDLVAVAARALAEQKVALLLFQGEVPLLLVLPERAAKRALALAGKKLQRLG